MVTLGLATICAFIVCWLGMLRQVHWKLREVAWIFCLSWVGGMLHIAFDSLNTYGVHPFWPLNSRWFYGDSVFILEPTLWSIGLGLVLFALVGWYRLIALAALVGSWALVWFTHYVPALCCVLYTMAVLVYLLVMYFTPERVRAWATALSMALFIGVFSGASYLARRQFAATQKTWYPLAQLQDVALSPLPANPFCWSAISVETEGDTYLIRRAMYAPFPRFLTVDRCPLLRVGIPTASHGKGTLASNDRLLWLSETRLSLLHLQQITAAHCGVRAFLRFSRIPFLQEKQPKIIAGDARFDWEPELRFAEMEFDSVLDRCPPFIPPWIPPRGNILPVE